ncbi:acetolactate synthase 3 regulatory subunit [Listeria monocytogenes]|nr:acetolactate synthase 3 regulatory subunit [Listeria monocytogenes]
MLSLTQFDRMVLSKWRGPASQALQEALKKWVKNHLLQSSLLLC